MKMFATKSAEVVTEFQQAFGFQPILNQISCRKIIIIIITKIYNAHVVIDKIKAIVKMNRRRGNNNKILKQI